MKKHNLFKVLAIVMLVAIVASYFIAARGNEATFLAFAKGAAKPIGFGDVVVYFAQSFYHFFDAILFVLVVGAFYGVLSRVPSYEKLVNGIASSFKESKLGFVISVTVIFALLSSVAGLELVLFMFIPFVVAIILKMGYDKLVALSSTVGAILVGTIGGLFVTFRDPSSMYGVNYTTFDKFAGLDGNYVTVIPRLILFVLGLVLLVLYVVRHTKKNDTKYDLGSKLELAKAETKDEKVSLWPMIVLGAVLVRYITIIIAAFVKEPNWYGIVCNCVVLVAMIVLLVLFRKAKKVSGKLMLSLILCTMLVFLILGFMPWASLFNVTAFDTIHTQVIKDFTWGSFSWFESLLSSNFAAFGQWATWGNFLMPIVMMLVMMIVIKFVFNIKFDDLFDSFKEGFRKAVPVAILVAVSYTILVCTYNNGFMETVINTVGNNAFVQAIVSMFGVVFSVDLYYSVAAVFNPIMQVVTDNGKVMAVAFQSLYGLVQLIGPTSLLLIAGLTYFDVPYRTWVKYIWRFVLAMFVLIFAVLLILALV